MFCPTTKVARLPGDSTDRPELSHRTRLRFMVLRRVPERRATARAQRWTGHRMPVMGLDPKRLTSKPDNGYMTFAYSNLNASELIHLTVADMLVNIEPTSASAM